MRCKIGFSFVAFLMICLRMSAQDRSTPEATVRSFLTAFGSGKMNEVTACVKGANLSGSALEDLARQIKKEPATMTLSNAQTTVNGADAVVAGQVTMKFTKSEKAQVFTTRVKLSSSGGSWQIVPDNSSANSRNPDMVNMLAYAITNKKVFAQARDSARSVSCLSNIRQISTGAMMLLQDSDQKFKLKAEVYKKSLMPYIKNESVFKCPSDTRPGTSYSFNSNLAGVSLARIKAPAETVMIYEGKNCKLDFRHDGRAAVGFADGHAKLVSSEGAKKLRWKP